MHRLTNTLHRHAKISAALKRAKRACENPVPPPWKRNVFPRPLTPCRLQLRALRRSPNICLKHPFVVSAEVNICIVLLDWHQEVSSFILVYFNVTTWTHVRPKTRERESDRAASAQGNLGEDAMVFFFSVILG